MSNSSSNPLGAVVLIAVGVLAGLSLGSQRSKIPAIGGPRPTLDPANPRPAIEIALGSALVEAGGRLRHELNQVPSAIRESFGFGPASLSVREDIDLPHHAYAVRLRGLPVAVGEVFPDKLFAMGAYGDVPGVVMEIPLGKRQGVWISEQDAGQARLLGYDVMEPGFVLALHVDTVLRRHLFELLTREETYRLLERARQLAPRTVEELVGRIETGRIQNVLQTLLREQVNLRDLPLVLELLSDAATKSQNVDELVEDVRTGLARQLCASLSADGGILHVLPLGPRWEQLRNAKPGDERVRELIGQLRGDVNEARDLNLKPILVAPRELRAAVRRMIERDLPDLPVLSEREIDHAFTLKPIVGLTREQG